MADHWPSALFIVYSLFSLCGLSELELLVMKRFHFSMRCGQTKDMAGGCVASATAGCSLYPRRYPEILHPERVERRLRLLLPLADTWPHALTAHAGAAAARAVGMQPLQRTNRVPSVVSSAPCWWCEGRATSSNRSLRQGSG